MRPANQFPAMGFLLLLLMISIPASAAETLNPHQHGFIKGISWGWMGSRGEYASPKAAESMKQLAETGTEWVCIAYSCSMKTPHDPNISWGDKNSSGVTDDEIRRAIDIARNNGLKVILKPVVNCDDGIWRAWIRFFRPITDAERAAGETGEFDPWGAKPQMREGMVTDMKQWGRWWSNYSKFLTHYAKIAQEKNVEMFCIGCEMSSSEKYEDNWRDVIAQVREAYEGSLIYDINHGREAELNWWDAVDAIGVSAYYEVPTSTDVPIEKAIQSTTPLEQIKERLRGVKQHLAEVSKKWDKPVLFIETGVANVRGCARYPWSHPNEKLDSPLDEEEQANYYRAFFEVFWDEPWLMGFTWWEWPARLYDRESADENRGFCIYGKQAEDVLRKWYAKPR